MHLQHAATLRRMERAGHDYGDVMELLGSRGLFEIVMAPKTIQVIRRLGLKGHGPIWMSLVKIS